MDPAGAAVPPGRNIRRTEVPDLGPEIAGHPYSISVLKVGYCLPQPDGSTRADGTISLLRGPRTILVDTGGPWDRDFLLCQLKQRNLAPDDVELVVGTHGHSDHVGNLGLFPGATLVVGCDVSRGDRYLPNQLAEGRPYPIDDHVSVVPTPGHTGRDVSVLVRGTSLGDVLVAGDLFECCDDDASWRELSENPEVQEVSRMAALQSADVIVPGHGPLFRVVREQVD
ncbi:metallo-beta-lactamase domain-containing protein 1 [Denticeps clupeoides]|uniref:Metallo-beta-lactamase domain-containing protein 1 n=1 Tax=Denticeps clupeoides TaxID=299321 RepID=A0AAY4ARY8_9TELE|nr:metallo-beta-lactamase domain-containing protein 1 [Denticeps clupeoides]